MVFFQTLAWACLPLFLPLISAELEDTACDTLPSGSMRPHPLDCSSFYYCTNGFSQIQSCASGLSFNPETNTCQPLADLPYWTPCLQLTDDFNVFATTESYVPTCNYTTISYKLPHPYDCSKYFICLRGISKEETCPVDQLFNPDVKNCDNPANLPPTAPCRQTVVPSTTTPATSTAPASTSFGTTPAPTNCTGLTDGTYLPDVNDCAVYYVCLGGSAITQRCPEGLLFNPDSKLCVIPSQLPPTAPCLPQIPTTTEAYVPLCDGLPNGAYLPHPADCTAYFICIAETPTPQVCPGGLQFNPNTNVCVDIANMPPDALCNQPPPVEACKNATDGTYLPDPLSCQGYYVCISGNAIPFDCTPLFYDPQLSKCVTQAALPPGVPCSTSTAPPSTASTGATSPTDTSSSGDDSSTVMFGLDYIE